MITALEIGILRIKVNLSWTPIIVLGGFAATKNDEVIVLISVGEKMEKQYYSEAKDLLAKATRKFGSSKNYKIKN